MRCFLAQLLPGPKQVAGVQLTAICNLASRDRSLNDPTTLLTLTQIHVDTSASLIVWIRYEMTQSVTKLK